MSDPIRDALEQALYALDLVDREGECSYPAVVSNAIHAVKAALASLPVTTSIDTRPWSTA
jgi:hypothetical protein